MEREQIITILKIAKNRGELGYVSLLVAIVDKQSCAEVLSKFEMYPLDPTPDD